MHNNLLYLNVILIKLKYMIKKNNNKPRSGTRSKCELRKKIYIYIYIYIFAFKVYDFLTIHMVTLLELEQIEIKAKKTT